MSDLSEEDRKLLERLDDKNFYLHEGQCNSVEIGPDDGSFPKRKPNPESLDIYQYAQISDIPLPRDVIMGRIRDNGDLVDKNSEQYYMTHSEALHVNCRIIQESLRDYHKMGRRSKSMHPSTIVTSCNYSDCYGFCGRRDCLNSTRWGKR